MAFPTGTFTGASGDLDVLIPEIWGSKLNDFFKNSLRFAQFFTDRSDELSGGGDTIYTPNITEMTAYSKSNATAVTLNSPTETKVNLVVDQWYEVSFSIEDRELAFVKKSYSIQEKYMENAAYTTAKKLESAIAALFSGFSNSVGASTTNLADSEIRAAIATLESNSVPGIYDGMVAFFMHPNTVWRQVMGIDKFTLLQNTNGADPVLKGMVGTLYGIPVIVSELVPNVSGADGRYNLLAHKDAIHFATGSLPSTPFSSMNGRVRLTKSYEPRYLAHVFTADILYGVIENRDAAGVKILSHATAA